MNKIQNVLNDEESMKQIKELADMLTADNGGQENRAVRAKLHKALRTWTFLSFSKA